MGNVSVITVSIDDLRQIVLDSVAEAITGASPKTNRVVTKEELAEAMSCAGCTIDRMVREGMPFVLVGQSRRFEVDACMQWCANRKTKRKQRVVHAQSDVETVKKKEEEDVRLPPGVSLISKTRKPTESRSHGAPTNR